MSDLTLTPAPSLSRQLPAWLAVTGVTVGYRFAFNIQALPLDLRAFGIPLACLLGYWLFVRLLEHREPRELRGGAHSLGQFGVGLLLALFRSGLVIATGFTLGLITLQSGQAGRHVLAVALFTAGSAFIQELLYRGLALRYLELKLGSYAAIALSALIFALPHLVFISGVSAIQLADFFVAGVALGCAYVLTRRLWLSIGMHVGHNVLIVLLFVNPLETVPLVYFEPIGDGFWVRETGVELLWLMTSILVAAGLLIAVVLRRAAVSADQAWSAQLGATRGPQHEAETAPAVPPVGSMPAFRDPP